MDLLKIPSIVAAIGMAWQESQTDSPLLRHEEGGYIVLDGDSYAVERWPTGGQCRIVAPAMDSNGCYNGKLVVAAFHTHPNPPLDEAGREWSQGPSEADRRWHGRRKLPGIVVSQMFVYEIDGNISVRIIGRRVEVLKS